uniref:4Fe-4S dicluster domain-containing protein n=1 Tax=Candidatus Methanomethylicus mesodigestus TaxID=1867258 RepID=A0A7C3J4B0_9CREN
MSIFLEACRSLLKPKATLRYPLGGKDSLQIPDGYRGKMALKREACIGCTICEKDCPSSAIIIITDQKGKRPVFYLDRCMFCGQCKESCPTKAISFTKDFENASYDRKTMEVR